MKWIEANCGKRRNNNYCYYTWFVSDQRWFHLQSQNNWRHCVHQNLPHIYVQDYISLLNSSSCLSCCPLPFVDHHFSPKHHHFLLICSNMESRIISSLFSCFTVFCPIYDSFFKPVILNNQPLCPLSEGLNFHLLSVNFTLKNCCLDSKTASSAESVIRLSGTKRPEEVSPRSVQGSGSL